ncbi:unnamed protein product [Hapterophycus canaliculatus]
MSSLGCPCVWFGGPQPRSKGHPFVFAANARFWLYSLTCVGCDTYVSVDVVVEVTELGVLLDHSIKIMGGSFVFGAPFCPQLSSFELEAVAQMRSRFLTL